MEKIIIEFIDGKDWFVTQGNKQATKLGWDEMLGLVSILTMPEERPHLQWMKEKKVYIPLLRNVFLNKKTGNKFVVRSSTTQDIIDNPGDYEYICSRPHEDGDFSYVCNFEWCRCTQ